MGIKQLGLSLIVMVLLTTAASAQNINLGQWTSIIGNWNVNSISPNSTSNRFGAGNENNPNSINKPHDSDSISNPYGPYRNPFSSSSPNNPYGDGLSITAE